MAGPSCGKQHEVSACATEGLSTCAAVCAVSQGSQRVSKYPRQYVPAEERVLWGVLLRAEGPSLCPMSSRLRRSYLPPADQVEKRERRGGGPSRPVFPASPGPPTSLTLGRQGFPNQHAHHPSAHRHHQKAPKDTLPQETFSTTSATTGRRTSQRGPQLCFPVAHQWSMCEPPSGLWLLC